MSNCRQRKERLKLAREKIRSKLAEESKRKASKLTPKPRYDEVYFKGVEWLNSL